MEIEDLLFVIGVFLGIFALAAFLSPKSMSAACSYGLCYKPASYEYEKSLYCHGHYLMRKHDPYFFYAFL